ncbi:MAG: HD domain-containing protein [Lachnospiraceae bacterium]|nr:HD domain-containing protein [Lachnospiraceae bacterium]
MELIAAAIAFVEKLFEGNSDGHGADHTMRVYRNAMIIAQTEECDRQIVALAALLHDADDHKLFRTKNNANARDFLKKHGLEEPKTEQIVDIINAVSFSKNGDKKPSTIEGQIVQDADRLDAMGAVGIARTFAYGGSHGRDLESSIRHFHEKLLLLKALMNTGKAREMAESRHKYLLGFLNEWKIETADPRTEGDCFIPQIDLESAILTLKKRKKDVWAYFEIMEEAKHPERPEFQKKYDAFYRVRRNAEWRKEYFDLMGTYKKQGKATFSEVLHRLYQATDQIEASFASKMLATIDANMPIWDSKVLAALKLRVSGTGAGIRFSNTVLLYDRICSWYREFLKTENAKAMIIRFDKEFPEFQSISPTKKIDFILWASR